ncbi:FtsQ-type POTRA domain-containing protein [Bacillus timonensis]|nr:FtsQ-type POTRA domain-containing protein [Bacillus timonensis]
MGKGKVLDLEDRIPQIKQKRRQKANKRLIFYLSFFFLMISMVVYIQSPLSKVSQIKISGNVNVETSTIESLSGIKKNKTSFWMLDKQELVRKIQGHKEVDKVIVKKQFPNYISIEIEEYTRVAYIVKDSLYYPILENGQSLKNIKRGSIPVGAPLLFNWINAQDIEEMAVQLKKLPVGILHSISEIHLTPEETDPLHITLYMNDGYEVSATVRNFAKKMSAYPSIINELDPSLKGVIHLEVVPYFKAYEQEGDDTSESEG